MNNMKLLRKVKIYPEIFMVLIIASFLLYFILPVIVYPFMLDSHFRFKTCIGCCWIL